MLEVFISIICTTIASCGYIISLKALTSNNKKFEFRDYLWILFLIVFSGVFYSVEYSAIYSIFVFMALIVVTKKILNLNSVESMLTISLLICILFICEMINSIIYMSFTTIDQVRGVWYFRILSNISMFTILVILCNLNKTQKIYNLLITKTKSKNKTIEIIFLVLCVIVFLTLTYNLIRDFGWNRDYFMNIGIMLIFFIMIFIFIKEKDDYNKLSYEYDSLFTYIQNFEEWIEKEQLNRHEYKNQLAVLRCLTKEKKVKDKIDEILEDNINLEGEVVHQLKSLPKGGIKGLMYYKAAIAQKNKINLTVTTSLETKSILNKLTEQETRVLCKLIGIYFDNAIEAAKETRKKDILIEIYEFPDRVNFVFSNSFKQHKNFKDRNKKGVSTKGEGRGNGLYFASKLISKSDWIEEKQEVIDRYYIQQLIIKRHKNTSSK